MAVREGFEPSIGD